MFHSTVPERGGQSVFALLKPAQERGLVRVTDEEMAARMFFGPLLTYVMLEGLFVGDGPPREPAPERIEEMVHRYVKTIVV